MVSREVFVSPMARSILGGVSVSTGPGDGKVVFVSNTVSAKPPTLVRLIVEEPEEPMIISSKEGLASMVKSSLARTSTERKAEWNRGTRTPSTETK